MDEFMAENRGKVVLALEVIAFVFFMLAIIPSFLPYGVTLGLVFVLAGVWNALDTANSTGESH